MNQGAVTKHIRSDLSLLFQQNRSISSVLAGIYIYLTTTMHPECIHLGICDHSRDDTLFDTLAELDSVPEIIWLVKIHFYKFELYGASLLSHAHAVLAELPRDQPVPLQSVLALDTRCMPSCHFVSWLSFCANGNGPRRSRL
jgi:hypothetical protein